jgi:23S rRNA (adenine2503-C2)-methyltransferase
MGEPALNPAVLEVLNALPHRYDNPYLVPCIATTAPAKNSGWFEELLKIKQTIYQGKTFQLQFSINSTDEAERDRLMPIPKWGLSQIAEYGMRFVANGDRKVSLNFALTEGVSVDAQIVARYFDPKKFCIKVTPLNPTETASINQLTTSINPPIPPLIKGGAGGFVPYFKRRNSIPNSPFEKGWSGGICLSQNSNQFISDLQNFGFDVIISIGEPKENDIGSNCGQAVRRLRGNIV